jgi:acetyl-CoA carboxylase carboxyl transferase subunit beta
MNADEQGWRDHLGTEIEPLPGSGSLRCGISRFGSTESGSVDAVVVRWDFSHQGGSFGSMETTSFIAATHVARDRRLPLVTVMRSGGTKLPEGMRALVGIPRAALALEAVRAAGLPHISIADNPTTGGVWVSIGTRADLRIAMADAFIGFSGPRVVEAMTGRSLPDGAGTAQAAYDAGLVDLIATAETIADEVAALLHVLSPDQAELVDRPSDSAAPDLAGDEQVEAAQNADRPGGQDLIESILDERFPIKGADDEVSAAIGRVAGRRVIAVALGAHRGSMPGPAGFALLERCAALAGSLGTGLLCLVDTPGADPHTEAAGLSAAIAGSLLAVLSTPAPTIALVHGEGGSGGALAGAVTDVVGVSRYGWFAALGPQGAAAALRIDPAEASRLMRVTPSDLLTDGLADEYVAPGTEAAWVARHLDALQALDQTERLEARTLRWSSPLV